MSGMLKSIPGLVQTVIDNLAADYAAIISAIAGRAPAASALDKATWSDALAASLATAAQDRGPIAGGLLGGPVQIGDANSYGAMDLCGVDVTTVTSTTDVDIINLSGAGEVSFLMAHNGNVTAQGFLTVTRDGVVEYPATAFGGSAYSRRCLIGAFAMNGTLIGGIAFEPIKFSSSLRIQARVASGGQMKVLRRARKAA